ncbi:50S ribosomal protein L15 [candidate division BRC1 bacterium HGW-BRC1-1]|jgi:large subunit ribosomal protein L15|nr:ribosomal protein L15 [uncultured bacterium]PKO18636.1 MAG: 50S ribosomal protein L15 [candidate division BRC1 bacterium HGW-BRC1-1]
MKIHELGKDPGRMQKRKRVGRGESSGHGKTSGYGHKGSQARSGRGKGYGGGFEGGQMPLQRRLPKVGFVNIFRKEFEVVNVASLEVFDNGTDVTMELLKEAGLVRMNAKRVKVLGNGDLSKKLTVKAHAFSGTAKEKIENAGGTAVAPGAKAE